MDIRWIPGFADYGEIYAMQEEMAIARAQDASLEDELLLMEHESVYTIGRTRDHSSLHPATLLPHPVFEINRGGQATYHGPGQLVGYPIVNLNRFGRDLHDYILSLEDTLIRTCASFGVKSSIKEGLVGVWVGDKKIASIGVGIKKWITMHGFAINIMPESLPPFGYITPCGIDGVQMTCLTDEMGGGYIPDLIHTFGNRFATLWERLVAEKIQLTASY
ncbi:MAG: lipoyl(octanoyl) transferase LipB [Akkermansia sp.]